MIIFYDKTSGDIIGTIDGRIHSDDHMKMWIGDPATTKRVVVNWKPHKWFDKDQNEIPVDLAKSVCDENGDLLAVNAEFTPDADSQTATLVKDLEKAPHKIHSHHRIDVKTGKLRKKTTKELKDQQIIVDESLKQAEIEKSNNESRKVLINDPKQPIEKRFEALLELNGAQIIKK